MNGTLLNAATGSVLSAVRKTRSGRVDELLKAGYHFVVDADLKSYFDTIPHAPLMALVGAKVSDGRVLKLIQAFLEQGVMSDGGVEEPETGTPQGAVLSPLLSNIYLDPLDHLIAARGWEMVRYADHFLIGVPERSRSACGARAACKTGRPGSD